MAKILNSYHKFKSNMTTAAGRTLNIVLKISWWYGQKYIFENILVVRSKIYLWPKLGVSRIQEETGHLKKKFKHQKKIEITTTFFENFL